MALIKCAECGKDVSDKASSCPHCGVSPVVEKRESMSVVKWVAVLFFGAIVYQCASSTSGVSEQQRIEQARKISSAAPSAPALPPTPPKRTPEVEKELARLRSLDRAAFCAQELGKVRKLKGAWPQPWGEAITAALPEYGVTSDHLDHIKKRSAVIGMSTCGGLASWGRPESVNRSTYSSGTKEQWVYGGGNYLYFTNDKLDSIQN